MEKWDESVESLRSKFAVPAIYVFARESSDRYKRMRSRAGRLAASVGHLPKLVSFRDWMWLCVPGKNLTKKYVRLDLHQRTGLRDLVAHLVGLLKGEQWGKLGVCVVGNYDDAFGKYDQRAVVEFFHSYNILVLDASCENGRLRLNAPGVERTLVDGTAAYGTTKQMLGRLKAAVTRKIRGTAVGKQPVEVDAKYQEELNRAMRSLARRPRRSPSNTGKRAPRYRASYAKVADGLNARGIPDPRGKAWTRSAVHRYLQKNLPGLIQHRKASPSNSSSRRRRTKGVKGESR